MTIEEVEVLAIRVQQREDIRAKIVASIGTDMEKAHRAMFAAATKSLKEDLLRYAPDLLALLKALKKENEFLKASDLTRLTVIKTRAWNVCRQYENWQNAKGNDALQCGEIFNRAVANLRQEIEKQPAAPRGQAMSGYRPLDLHDDMPFGKYKGETISELTETDYRYLCWLRDEGKCEFTEDVLETLKNKEMGL